MEDLLSKHVNNLTKDEWEYLYNEKGMNLSSLSKNFGVCIKTIAERLKSFGISRRSCGHRLNAPIDVDRLKTLYIEENRSIEEVSKIFGVATSTIRGCIKKNNIPFHKDILKNKLNKDYLKIEYEDNKRPASSIAKELGVSTVIVCSYLRKYGFNVKGGFKQPAVNAETEMKIVDLYCSGIKATIISKDLGIYTNTVYNVLNKHGVERRSNNSYIKILPDVETIRKDYFDSGMSLLDMSNKYGVSKSAVRKALNGAGFMLRSKSESKLGTRNNMYGVKHTDETRSKMSEAYQNDVRDLSNELGRGKHEEVMTPFQGKTTVRSSWEAAVCRYFNAVGVKYLYEPKVFSLTINGIKASYKPDFLVLYGFGDKETYLEIKGLWKEDSKEKTEEFVKLGNPLLVWEGKDLIEKGILSNSYKPLF